MYGLRASFVTIVFAVSIILRLFFVYSAPAVAAPLMLDYFLHGFSSYHTQEWIAIILIAFKFLDLKALCVCAATTVSLCYFVQHIPLSTIRVLFHYTNVPNAFFFIFFFHRLSDCLFFRYFASVSYTFNSHFAKI